MNSPHALALGSVILVSLLSLIGALPFALQGERMRSGILYLVSFSVGALLGDVFLHIIPEMAEEGTLLGNGVLLILGGILFSFVMEKMIHWRHCHVLPPDHHHCHPVGLMSLLGDGVHNFIDGALIAGSFLASTEVGIATTIAVMLHEIPQELGDFAVLIHSGFSRSKALLWNLASAGLAIVGALAVLLANVSAPLLGSIILPLAAGNFLYIAGSDLIPELHKEARLKHATLQLLSILLGIMIMLALTGLE